MVRQGKQIRTYPHYGDYVSDVFSFRLCDREDDRLSGKWWGEMELKKNKQEKKRFHDTMLVTTFRKNNTVAITTVEPR